MIAFPANHPHPHHHLHPRTPLCKILSLPSTPLPGKPRSLSSPSVFALLPALLIQLSKIERKKRVFIRICWMRASRRKAGTKGCCIRHDGDPQSGKDSDQGSERGERHREAKGRQGVDCLHERIMRRRSCRGRCLIRKGRQAGNKKYIHRMGRKRERNPPDLTARRRPPPHPPTATTVRAEPKREELQSTRLV